MLNKGFYETRCGMKAVVAKLKPLHGKFFLFGGIYCSDGSIALHAWDIEGRSQSHQEDRHICDLVKELPTEATA